MPNNVNNSLPLEFNDVLPPGVEAFDDESWQINDKYVSNKSQNNDKQSNSESHTHTHTTKVIASEATDKHEVAEGESKNTKDKDKDKKVNKDKKRRKKEKEKEKDVDGKKSKKHKREKSDRDVSQVIVFRLRFYLISKISLFIAGKTEVHRGEERCKADRNARNGY